MSNTVLSSKKKAQALRFFNDRVQILDLDENPKTARFEAFEVKQSAVKAIRKIKDSDKGTERTWFRHILAVSSDDPEKRRAYKEGFLKRIAKFMSEGSEIVFPFDNINKKGNLTTSNLLLAEIVQKPAGNHRMRDWPTDEYVEVGKLFEELLKDMSVIITRGSRSPKVIGGKDLTGRERFINVLKVATTKPPELSPHEKIADKLFHPMDIPKNVGQIIEDTAKAIHRNVPPEYRPLTALPTAVAAKLGQALQR